MYHGCAVHTCPQRYHEGIGFDGLPRQWNTFLLLLRSTVLRMPTRWGILVPMHCSARMMPRFSPPGILSLSWMSLKSVFVEGYC